MDADIVPMDFGRMMFYFNCRRSLLQNFVAIFTQILMVIIMNKYQVTVFFSVDEEFMMLVPKHRLVINELILKCVIDSYAISAEVGRGWITMNAKDKSDIHKILERSPLYPYFELEIFN